MNLLNHVFKVWLVLKLMSFNLHFIVRGLHYFAFAFIVIFGKRKIVGIEWSFLEQNLTSLMFLFEDSFVINKLLECVALPLLIRKVRRVLLICKPKLKFHLRQLNNVILHLLLEERDSFLHPTWA